MNWKRVIIAFIILILIGTGGFIFYYNHSGITGEEWFFAQEKYIDELGELCDELDNVSSLYINGNIAYEDYKNHINVIEREFLLIQANYEKDKEHTRIKDGSHTYISKKGVEATEETFDLIGKLIETCSNEEIASNPANLSYQYLTAQQAIQKSMAKYITSKVMYDPENMIHGPEESSTQEKSVTINNIISIEGE